jgi:hypothetical protein
VNSNVRRRKPSTYSLGSYLDSSDNEEEARFMQHYSPFGRPITALASADLANLFQTAEGWYVEYKQECPNAAAVAKSVSAFGNTYGGWLFLGVQELSKEHPVAGAFPGIARDDVDATLQRLRKAVADHLNPTPHFETRVLWGPEEQVGLAADRAVVCVWIPNSPYAPHVHKSGQIYRRVSDSSEPKPENDRFVLDQLWRRGDDIKRQHKEWYEADPEFAEHEKAVPYVRLMLIADPWAQRDIWIESDDQVRSALGHSSGVSAIPFDNVYTSGDGFVGRQLKGNDPSNLTLTWRVRRNLKSDVLIPLPLYRADTPNGLLSSLKGYKYPSRFLSVLNQYTCRNVRVVDLNYLFNILIGVAEVQERLCRVAGWTESYFFKVKLLNSWRTLPFVDVPGILERYASFGPPMCLDSVCSLPRQIGPEHYLEVNRHEDIENERARMLVQALLMFSPLALCYGIPTWLPRPEDEVKPVYYESLQEAGRRALDAQTLRNQKST